MYNHFLCSDTQSPCASIITVYNQPKRLTAANDHEKSRFELVTACRAETPIGCVRLIAFKPVRRPTRILTDPIGPSWGRRRPSRGSWPRRCETPAASGCSWWRTGCSPAPPSCRSRYCTRSSCSHSSTRVREGHQGENQGTQRLFCKVNVTGCWAATLWNHLQSNLGSLRTACVFITGSIKNNSSTASPAMTQWHHFMCSRFKACKSLHINYGYLFRNVNCSRWWRCCCESKLIVLKKTQSMRMLSSNFI